MPQSFVQAYKSWRNRARKFSAESLLNMAATVLHEPLQNTDAELRHLEDLRRLPWNILLLVKWVCQDRMHDRVSRTVTRNEFDKLRQILWDLPGDLGLQIHERNPFYLFVRQRIYQQMQFQRPLTYGFVREAALIESMSEGRPLSRKFQEITGVSVTQFLDVSVTLSERISRGDRLIALSWFNNFWVAYSADVVDRYIELISRTFPQLRSFARQLPDAKEKVLRSISNLRRSRDTLFCARRTFFFAGIRWCISEGWRA